MVTMKSSRGLPSALAEGRLRTRSTSPAGENLQLALSTSGVGAGIEIAPSSRRCLRKGHEIMITTAVVNDPYDRCSWPGLLPCVAWCKYATKHGLATDDFRHPRNGQLVGTFERSNAASSRGMLPPRGALSVADQSPMLNCHCSNCRHHGSAFSRPPASRARSSPRQRRRQPPDFWRSRRPRCALRSLRLAALLGSARRRLRPRRHGHPD